MDGWRRSRTYLHEAKEKVQGRLPMFLGSPERGFQNQFGWQLQGFIEDEAGRLRAQTAEEHQYCMGCHTNLGVTIDMSFSFPRKVPGADGWRYQDLAGIHDVPQLDQPEPEALTYLERVGGGDEFRS